MSDENILIVEDEMILAMSMKQELMNLDYNIVDVVDTGEKAIKSANELKPDLIMMDITLKGKMDGIESAKQINENLDIPIIYMTAYSNDDVLNRIIKTKTYGYLCKPFEKEEMNTAIKTIISKHKSRIEIIN
ncbi:response regulator [Methanobacterium paludis]|uniref:Response regulator receiver protein n=1 Tax=Methanobacterium paludis (strain DSM 25820 / JCM 18151 / SWAN1) TaxID=868131 RepID=F6D4V0_METPW|nr:response regulator [Methanobacterium paludis]AEG18159.1 response regulator receiver protein [Methanobacterium paludis]